MHMGILVVIVDIQMKLDLWDRNRTFM